MSKLNLFIKNALLSSFVIFSFSISAQEVEEVVVTATKKEESLQDIAISVEAYTAESLDVNQVYDIDDLAEITPGLETAKVIGSGAGWTLRGIGSFGIGAGVVSSVVTAVNGHSVNDSVISDLGFMDLERVEVLKGPQGTLYGRNAANGMINLITARPTSELGGSYDVEIGSFGQVTTNAVLNLPISDSVRTRLAVMSNKRDGMVTNTVTGNDFDDRNDVAYRLSVDWDITDKTGIKFTYSDQESDDNRFNEEISYCKQDQFYGCSPFEKGSPNVAADTRGHIAGVFGFFAHLHNGSIANLYGSNVASTDFQNLALDREPTHYQKNTTANLELNHDLTDNLLLTAKFSYETRDFHIMGDLDQSYTTDPLPGSGAAIGLPPIEGFVCFGGERQFCETVKSDATYDFSDVNMHGTQMEINIISDFDGPFNYTAGIYQIENRNDNVYLAQTAGSAFFSSFSLHPYSTTVNSLFGLDFSAKGGLPFYQQMLVWLGATQPLLGCQQGSPLCTNPQAVIAAHESVTEDTLAFPNLVMPTELNGVVNDQNADVTSSAVYGEMYFDLSDDTKLTLGARYSEDSVDSVIYNDNAGGRWFESGGWLVNDRDTLPFIDYDTQEDDSFSYKIALQHNVSDDVMVYGSYTTAVKAGGVNAGDNPTLYDQEKVGVFDLGLRSTLMDGALRLNMNVFNSQNDGFLLAAVVNTGTQNKNADAEITGFEGNMMMFLSENTMLEASWLFLDHEIVSDTKLINYLNPVGAPVAQYVGIVDPLGAGVTTAAVHTNGVTLFKSGGYNCTAAFAFTLGCPGDEGIPVSLKGNSLPGSADESYSVALTQLFNMTNGVTSARLSYRYTGESNTDVFNMERFDLEARDTIDFLVRYEPNNADWYVGLFVKNIEDEQQVQSLRAASNVQGGQLFGSFTDPRIYGLQFGSKF